MTVNVFPWHFSGFLFGFVHRLVGDPAFLSADMKVLAICKCYGKIIRLVAGISQGDPDGEAFFASHLKFLRGERVEKHDRAAKAKREKVESSEEAELLEKVDSVSGDSTSTLDSLIASLENTLENVIPQSSVKHLHQAHRDLPPPEGISRPERLASIPIQVRPLEGTEINEAKQFVHHSRIAVFVHSSGAGT